MSDNHAELLVQIKALLDRDDLEPLPISTAPKIVGRKPTKWIMDNSHKIHSHEFYDQSLTEDDLRKIVDGRPDISLPHGEHWDKIDQ